MEFTFSKYEWMFPGRRPRQGIVLHTVSLDVPGAVLVLCNPMEMLSRPLPLGLAILTISPDVSEAVFPLGKPKGNIVLCPTLGNCVFEVVADVSEVVVRFWNPMETLSRPLRQGLEFPRYP